MVAAPLTPPQDNPLLTDGRELPSANIKSPETNLQWKKLALDTCSQHLEDDGATTAAQQPSQKPFGFGKGAFRLPDSGAAEHLDIDQLWQSLEFKNKSILPTTKRRLRSLLPTRKQLLSSRGENTKAKQLSELTNGEGFLPSTEREVDIGDADFAAGKSGDELGTQGRNDLPLNVDEENLSLSDKGRREVDLPDDEQSPLDAKASKQLRVIRALEEENVAPKPWSLRGEVSAASRPKNSLLQTTFEYDTAGKPKYLGTGDSNAAIEDMIKRRVADSQFDDVMPQPVQDSVLPDKGETEQHDSLSEKPTKGLAELYEEEFKEKKTSAQNQSNPELPAPPKGREKEYAAIYAAFEKVSRKLDTLSNVFVTPVINEIVTAPAEAVPEDVVREEAMITLREDGPLHTSDRKTGKSEERLSRDQRKRKRRKRKSTGDENASKKHK